jgi:hypothetical protein
VDGPIQFVPEQDGYRLRGRTVIGPLFEDDALAGSSALLASPQGPALRAAAVEWDWKVAA